MLSKVLVLRRVIEWGNKKMNLVEIATWIQDGMREYAVIKKANIQFHHGFVDKKTFVMSYVMREGKGHLNPKIIGKLIDLETSVPDENGLVQC